MSSEHCVHRVHQSASSTPSPTPIACLKLHVIFRTRASHHKALLRKMTYVDKASYDSTPPCTEISSFFSLKRGGEGKKGKKELSCCSHWGEMTLHPTSQESTSVPGITGISTSFSFAKKTVEKKKEIKILCLPPPKKRNRLAVVIGERNGLVHSLTGINFFAPFLCCHDGLAFVLSRVCVCVCVRESVCVCCAGVVCVCDSVSLSVCLRVCLSSIVWGGHV